MTNAAPLVHEKSPSTLPSREVEARLDLYGVAHKGLRFVLCHLLIEMGHASFGDERDAGMIAAALEVALTQCDRHIAHEDAVIRPALLQRTPKALARLDHEHEQHATQVAELRAMTKALREADGTAHRASIGRTLYLHFSVFVAETLAHMAYEERMVQPLLDRHFTFEEQLALHQEIVRSSTPPEMMEFMRAAIPASSREERFDVLKGARANLPPRAFQGLMSELLPLLAEADRHDLRARLGL
jgi:iron-sulfur cluster repair protein YtfE (RIC family)